MKVKAHTRTLLATTALAVVGVVIAGPANAAEPGTIPYLSHGIGVDESQFSGQGSLGLTGDSALTRVDRQVASTDTSTNQPGPIPYLSHGIGVDESLWSGQQSPKLTGVHAALARVNRNDTAAAVGLDPAIQRAIENRSGSTAGSQLGTQQSFGLTGDSPLTRVSAPEPEGLAGDSAATRYPQQVPTATVSGGNDTDWTMFGAGAGLAVLLAAGIAGALLSMRRRHTVGLP